MPLGVRQDVGFSLSGDRWDLALANSRESPQPSVRPPPPSASPPLPCELARDALRNTGPAFSFDAARRPGGSLAFYSQGQDTLRVSRDAPGRHKTEGSYVYGSTADVVYTGYAPGYLGTVVAPGPVVV